jgi:hypothetical protein
MGEVLYLGDMAWTMNKLRKSIAHDISINASGMYTEAIQKQKNLLRHFMDDIVQRPTEAVGDELAAA